MSRHNRLRHRLRLSSRKQMLLVQRRGLRCRLLRLPTRHPITPRPKDQPAPPTHPRVIRQGQAKNRPDVPRAAAPVDLQYPCNRTRLLLLFSKKGNAEAQSRKVAEKLFFILCVFASPRLCVNTFMHCCFVWKIGRTKSALRSTVRNPLRLKDSRPPFFGGPFFGRSREESLGLLRFVRGRHQADGGRRLALRGR